MRALRTLTLEEAHRIVDAAQKRPRNSACPGCFCVADNAGHPIALRRLKAAR